MICRIVLNPVEQGRYWIMTDTPVKSGGYESRPLTDNNSASRTNAGAKPTVFEVDEDIVFDSAVATLQFSISPGRF
jgi:hypothetical protein